ncbi:Flp family type IVb pilin [Lacibacterium aquatile]|uniref:Flp family type IVb pilin n=1 Tax=Lacibacterium aquatile TaxID=1168082 RepID=A0ABW5DRM8_9PROT
MLKLLCTQLRALKQDDDGATAIEYGLIVAGIAVAIIAAVSMVGDQLIETFTRIADGLK